MFILRFQVGGESFAVDSRRIVEVTPRANLRPLPHAPAYLVGLLHYRGQVVPVVDLNRLLGVGPSAARLQHAHHSGGTRAGSTAPGPPGGTCQRSGGSLRACIRDGIAVRSERTLPGSSPRIRRRFGPAACGGTYFTAVDGIGSSSFGRTMSWSNTVSNLLAKEIGLDVSSVGPTAIERAVLARIDILDLASPNEYLTPLGQSTAERDALIEEVVVPESWFFRDGRPFVRLQEHVREKRTRSVWRILSLPCAGGEEPYSIAIALREIDLPTNKFHIDAVDISSRALARAEAGIYGPSAFRGPEFCDRSRYFRPHPAGWEVKPDVRASVRFEKGNLLDPDLLAHRPAYDVIFCRNLLIYLTEAARRQAVDCLDRLLAKDGLLFVGHAESLSLLQPRFGPDADRASFAYRRTASPESKVPSPESKVPSPESKVPSIQSKVPSPITQALDSGLGTRDSGLALLDQAAELSNRHEHDRAVRLCQQALHKHGPEPRAFVLLGMIELARGQTEQAETNLLKAIYLDNHHEEALLALALICERRGDADAALRYHRRAERARRAKGTP